MARWSWRIGSIAGIPIRLHLSLLLLLVWIASSYWIAGLGPRASIAGIALFACVFTIIVVHELGHALMARRFGVRTREILLLPIGGIASLERIPDRPAQELVIALVGPMINFVLAGLLAAGLAVTGGTYDPTAATSLGAAFAAQLLWINVILGVFNLLPAFPLDGGRALRALLALKIDRERATAIATAAGMVLALMLGIVGVLVMNVWFVLIAAVVWLGARHERELVRIRSSLAGVPVQEVMSRNLEVVDADDTIGAAADRMVDTGSVVLPVLEHGHMIGAVTRADLVEGMRVAGRDAAVAKAPRHDVVRVTPNESLDQVLDDLQAVPDSVGVVVVGDQPIGLVTPEQLATYVALHPNRERTATA